MTKQRADLLFLLILCIDCILLSLMIHEVSISYREALIYFSQDSFAGFLANLSTQIFGHHDFALRLPFLLAHLCNLCLLYGICRNYLKHPIDGVLCVAIFALLPGVNLISILVSKSVLVLCFTLLLSFLYIQNLRVLFFPLCALASIMDYAFSVFFLALFFYAWRHKHNKTLLFSLIAFGVNMSVFTLDIGGIPQGHFLDTIGLLSLLYSPFLFVYFFYTLYHSLIKKEHSLILYIGATSIIFTLLLSLRQSIDLHTFLPLSAVGLPVMIKVFLHDLRIRLPAFRRSYVRRFYLLLFPLLLETSLLFCNKVFFLWDTHHFLGSFYYAKEIAKELKARGINSISTHQRLQLQLKFYGISPSPSLALVPKKEGSIKITYLRRPVKEYEILKK